jgi:hypothetical protein
MNDYRFANEFTRVVFSWLTKRAKAPKGGYEEAKALHEKHKSGSPAVPFSRQLENLFLTGLAERMPLLEKTHPLASQIALLAFDEVDWGELSEALIEVIEREGSEGGAETRK